ncbi:hypothetical protein IFM89_016134 [Coptis chinensis]|uniref:Uncharacterized protein n=1 Tax=Coptis chinensis TaxID=261450 RepID=A0A835LRS9_9MAGN|nr:hypothetical protein IFM89_016134 [Coptis chinensis]
MDPEENFNPNTEVDETFDSNMDPEENFNSNMEVDETPDSNMEENVTQRTGEKRKGRGAVVCSRLTKMKENERVDVVFNQNGQRIGEGGKDLASYSGFLWLLRVSIATYDNWHDVKGEARDRLWKFIKRVSEVPCMPSPYNRPKQISESGGVSAFELEGMPNALELGIPIEDLQCSLTAVVVPENIVLPSGDAHLHTENGDCVKIV